MKRTSTKALNCDEAGALLDDFTEGRANVPLAGRLEEHLATCSACNHEAVARRELRAAIAALPRSLEPATDLWSAIVPRLRERPARFGFSGLSRRGWALQAIAAMLFMALGAYFSLLLRPATPAVEEEAPAEAMTAAGPSAEFLNVEAEYLRAKEDLWLAAYHGRDRLSPATLEIVEHNLRIIDQAISELRTALVADPGNRQLESLLLASHQREIGLLQRMTGGPSVI